VLNAEWFATTRQAQAVINQWLKQYNYIRPHHALGMRPPVPETILVKPKSLVHRKGAGQGQANCELKFYIHLKKSNHALMITSLTKIKL
jgi:hypothetical protein